MNPRDYIAIQVQRRESAAARAHHPTMSGWRTLAYCAPCDAEAELQRQRARFGATAHTLDFRARRKNPPHAHVPAETVLLGHALDLTTQFRDVRTTWDFEIRDWPMLTDANAMDRRPGRAAVYLVRGTLDNGHEPNAPSVEPIEPRTPNVQLFSAGHAVITKLRRALAKHEETEAGWWRAIAAIGRLADGTATIADLEELATYADFAGLDWSELYPEWRESREHNPAAQLDAHPAAVETYERWHEREPAHVGELDIPELCGIYIGRAMRIGYRSDKWNARGKTVDYDHDFTEGTHIPPEVWADSAELEHARALVIVGGDMRVTEEGID